MVQDHKVLKSAPGLFAISTKADRPLIIGGA